MTCMPYMTKYTKRSRLTGFLAVGLLFLFSTYASVYAAVFYTETFSSGLSAWVDRDPGEMAVTYTPGFGDPAGSARGRFAAQAFFLPQTDAFRINGGSSGGAFTGNYWTNYLGFTGFRFEFFASNVVPSDITIRFGDGVNVFSSALGWQATNTLDWQTVSVSLDYYHGYMNWFGGTASQFSNALSNITFIDIEITRNGSGAQTYFVDNFRLVDELIFVPEPTSGLFWFGWALVFGGLRRKLAGRNMKSPYALTASPDAKPA